LPVSQLEEGDPEQVGSYRVVARLGEGGMGVVYLVAVGNGLGALKLIRPELVRDEDFRVRFGREVDAGKLVMGPYTARFVDARLEGPQPYLLTEYVEGPSLVEAVEQRGPFAFEELVKLASGIAQALRAVHRAGVVHRDVKPSNVLLSASGPRIIDFGIARALDSATITRTGLSIGSPAWMAPEVALGGAIGPPTDVFAWGGLVSFAATGRAPFGGGRPEGILFRIVSEEPDLTGLDERLLPIVQAAMAKDPADRPSAAELADWLSRFEGAAPEDPWSPSYSAAVNQAPRIDPLADPATQVLQPVVPEDVVEPAAGAPPASGWRAGRWQIPVAAVLTVLILAGVVTAVLVGRSDHASTTTIPTVPTTVKTKTTTPASVPKTTVKSSGPHFTPLVRDALAYIRLRTNVVPLMGPTALTNQTNGPFNSFSSNGDTASSYSATLWACPSPLPPVDAGQPTSGCFASFQEGPTFGGQSFDDNADALSYLSTLAADGPGNSCSPTSQQVQLNSQLEATVYSETPATASTGSTGTSTSSGSGSTSTSSSTTTTAAPYDCALAWQEGDWTIEVVDVAPGSTEWSNAVNTGSSIVAYLDTVLLPETNGVFVTQLDASSEPAALAWVIGDSLYSVSGSGPLSTAALAVGSATYTG
jgi:serine/threonine protein kinase